MKTDELHWLLRLCLVCVFMGQLGVVSANVQIDDTHGDNIVVKSSEGGDDHLGLGYVYLDAGKYRQALLEFFQELEAAGAPGTESVKMAEVHGAIGYALYLLQIPVNEKEDAKDDKNEKKDKFTAISELNLALGMATKLKNSSLEGRIRSYLGLVYAGSEETKYQARDEFRRSEALARSNRDWPLVYADQLQMARLEDAPSESLNKLREIEAGLRSAQMDDKARVALLLNIIDQLKHLQERDDKAAMAARRFGRTVGENALTFSEKNKMQRAQAQIEGYLAGLDAADGKIGEALDKVNLAITHANIAVAPDIAMNLQTQRGRLLAQQGKEEEAIKAYRMAAFHVDEVRNDIPLVYQDGRSSYSETLEPIYRGLSGLLLHSASRAKQQDVKQGLLLEAIYAVEKLKQSELEDYFNDRCALDTHSAMGGTASGAANLFLKSTPLGEVAKYGAITSTLSRATEKTAILYPIMFDDGLELMLVYDGTIRHETVKEASKERVTQQAVAMSNILRHGRDYLIPSKQLYQWIVQPFENDLRKEGINRIVYIPDGALRLAPLSAFSDGKAFVAERYEVVTNSVLQSALPKTEMGDVGKLLLAGLSVPDGPSVDQIPASLFGSGEDDDGREQQSVASRGVKTPKGTSTPNSGVKWPTPEARQKFVDSIGLPGVEVEINSIGEKLPNDTLLNETFTSQNLEDGVQSGEHQVIHIASHGYFGHSAKDSFVMTYDKNLGVGEVEALLHVKQGVGKAQPVDLVTFSACETAQGDERAPLGFSGLAIKASARNAMGALWPINDNATKNFMKEYYDALNTTHGDTAKSLHLAQVAMIKDKSPEKLNHPSYWAAFIIVGAW